MPLEHHRMVEAMDHRATVRSKVEEEWEREAEFLELIRWPRGASLRELADFT